MKASPKERDTIFAALRSQKANKVSPPLPSPPRRGAAPSSYAVDVLRLQSEESDLGVRHIRSLHLSRLLLRPSQRWSPHHLCPVSPQPPSESQNDSLKIELGRRIWTNGPTPNSVS